MDTVSLSTGCLLLAINLQMSACRGPGGYTVGRHFCWFGSIFSLVVVIFVFYSVIIYFSIIKVFKHESSFFALVESSEKSQ